MKNIKIAPSAKGYISPRTTETRLTTDNCKLILNDKIDSIERILLSGNGSIRTTATAGIWEILEITEDSTDAKDYPQIKDIYINGNRIDDLDLTEYFVEAQDYATLDIPVQKWGTSLWYDDLNRANTCFWTRGSNEITISTEAFKGWVAGAEKLAPVVCAVYSKLQKLAQTNEVYIQFKEKYIDEFLQTSYRIKKYVLEPSQLSDAFPIEFVPIELLLPDDVNKGWDTDLRLMLWRVEYTAQSTVKIHTVKSDVTDTQFVLPYNQQQEIISAKAMGKYAQSLADRTGVETKQIMRTVYSDDKLRPVGAIYKDGKDIWRLTSVSVETVGKVKNVVEQWAKNWSNQSQFVGVNRQSRSWDIPNKTVLREMRIDEYLFISNRRYFADDTYLNAYGIQAVMSGIWVKETEKHKPVDCLWLYRTEDEGVIINVCSFGFGNSIVINGVTVDNLSAGLYKVVTKDGSAEYQFCRQALYCEPDGTLEKMYLVFGSEIGSLSTTVYPKVLGKDYGQNVPDFSNTITNVFQINVEKDASEQLGLTYQLHFITDLPELIIGNAWASGNFITREYKEYSGIKVWGLTRPLPKGVQTMTEYYGDTIESWATYYSVDFSADHTFTFTPQGYKGVVVTNEDNEIIVGQNSSENHTYYLNFTKDYDKIRLLYY